MKARLERLKSWLQSLRTCFETNSIRSLILEKTGTQLSWNKTLLTIVIMALVTLASVFLLFHLATKTMNRNVRKSLEQTAEQQAIHFDFRLHNVQLEADNLMSSIYPYLSGSTDPLEQYQEYETLRSQLSLATGKEDIGEVRLYVPDNKFYSNQGGTFHSLSELDQDEDTSYLDHAGISWLETRTVRTASGTGVLADTNALICVYSMRQKTDYSRLSCVLMLDVRISSFAELLMDDNAKNQHGFLVSSQGICLASTEEAELGQQVIPTKMVQKIVNQESGSIQYQRSLYVFRKLSNFDWYIVTQYPASMLSVADSFQANFLKMMVIIVLIVALTIVFILAYHFITNLTLTRINATLEALNNGQTPLQEEAPEFLDPLHHLEHNADQMVLTINSLMEERYRDRLEIADSQMKSLQAQIKPHFLYNTLDIIKWMILDDQTEDAVWMVNALSKYLRQSINKGPAVIPLREELELSRNYLQIMQKRFKNRFTVCFEIEEEAEECRIPKLTLQPLLENALLHGVLYSEKPEKELTIRAWLAEEMLCIDVEDSGNGMSPEQQEQLEKGQTGYGFSNVRKRLELYGKGQVQCHIFSREGVGTCISIQIPATMQGNAFGEEF